MSEVIDDALQFTKIRMQHPAAKSKSGKDKRLVLSMDDLATALQDYGVALRKPDCFSDRLGGVCCVVAVHGTCPLLTCVYAAPLREGHPLLKPPVRMCWSFVRALHVLTSVAYRW